MVSRQNSIAARQNNCSRTVWLATLLLLAVGVHVVFLAIVRQKPFQVLPHKHRSYVRRLALQPGLPRNAKLLVVQAFVVQGARTPLSGHHFSFLEWNDCPAASHHSAIRAWPANTSSNSHGILGDGLLLGGCHQGMLTSHGYQTSFDIGTYLRQQYISRYSLLPPHYNPNSLLATSNAQQATIDSLHTVVAALFPNASNVSIQLDKAGSAPRKGSGSGISGTTCRKLIQLQGKLQQLQESKGGSTNSAEWQLLATRVQDLLLGLNRAINNITSPPGPAKHAANTKASAGARAHATSLASSVLQSMWWSTGRGLHNPGSHLQTFDSSLDSLHNNFEDVPQLDLAGRKVLQQLGSSTVSPAVLKVPQEPHQKVPAISKVPPAAIKVPQRPRQTVPTIHKVSPAVSKVPQRSHQKVPAIHKVSPAAVKVSQRPRQTVPATDKVSPAVRKAPQRPHQAAHSVPKASPSVSKKPVRHQQAVHISRSRSASSNPTTSSRSAADNPFWDHFLDELTCIAAREDASISSKARDILFYLEPWMLRNKLAIVAPGSGQCLSSRVDCEQVTKLGVGRLVHEILLQWQAAISTAEMPKNDQQDEQHRPGTEQTSQPNPRPLSWSDVMHVADPMQQPKLLLHGVEDTTLALLLRALGVQPTEWPPFSSNLELELWQHGVPSRNTSASNPRYFVRIMYQGLPILFTKQGTQLQGKLPYASRHADSSDSQLQERDFLCAYNSTSKGQRKCHSSNKAVGLSVVSLEVLKALALGKLALDSKQYAVACGGGNPAAAMD